MVRSCMFPAGPCHFLLTWAHGETVYTLARACTRWIYVFTTDIAYSHVTSRFVRHSPTVTGAHETRTSERTRQEQDSDLDDHAPLYWLLLNPSVLYHVLATAVCAKTCFSCRSWKLRLLHRLHSFLHIPVRHKHWFLKKYRAKSKR